LTLPQSDDQLRYVDMDDLVVSPFNVRRRDIDADVDELARSIDKYGLLQPIVVQPRADGKYSILIGQRRYLACKRLGWDTIAARLVSPGDEFSDKLMSFSENVQRRDLSPTDKAEVCAYLYQQLGSIRAVADELGISEVTVRKWVGYHAVPEPLKEMVADGQLTRGQASAIWETVGDAREAIEIGEFLSTKPPRDEQERLLAAAAELPDQPIAVIRQRAQEMRRRVEITFVLPENWTRVMEAASEETGREPADIAKEATIEWLRTHERL
jgi:ParB family chromosome partitioning protein